MKHIKIIAASGLLASGLVSAGFAQAAEPTGILPYLDTDTVAQGARLYADNCAACHGDKLQGEPDWRVVKDNGMRAAPPHDETGHTWHHPDAQLIDITKNGLTAIMARRGMDYQSEMIGFGEILSDAEILAVLGYIKSTWSERVIKAHNDINASQ